MNDYQGHELDESNLAPQFTEFYTSGQRIEVTNLKYDMVRRGYVGKTTGWRPVYILLNNTRSMGSGDVLGEDDKVTKRLPKYRF